VAAGDEAFWSSHRTYCSGVRRKNSKGLKGCEGCGLVLPCEWSAGDESALARWREHKSKWHNLCRT
jgi:hypothetical protein